MPKHMAPQATLEALIEHGRDLAASRDHAAALLDHTSALFRYQRSGDQGAVTRALINMGLSHLGLDELDAAAACFDQAYEIASSTRNLPTIGYIQLHRAELYRRRQHYETAAQCCDDALTIFIRIDSRVALAEAYKVFGAIYRESGKPHLADIHLSLAWGMARDADDMLLQAEVQHERARVHIEEQRNHEAIVALNSAHELFHALEQRRTGVATADASSGPATGSATGRQFTELDRTYLHAVARWGSESIEAKDPYTVGHSERVATYSCRIAEALGIGGRELTWLRIGGLLHDVGKTVVPAAVLVKPGVLNESEWDMMKRHTVVGHEIVAGLRLPFDVHSIARNHHERWDGQGYPDRLSGTAIPFHARILAVADVWDALTTMRSYRSAFSVAEARRILDHQSGRALDPHIVAAFQTLFTDLPSELRS